jgi:hypothetical protein
LFPTARPRAKGALMAAKIPETKCVMKMWTSGTK